MSVNATGVAAAGAVGSVVLTGVDRRARSVDLWARFQVEQMLATLSVDATFLPTARDEQYVRMVVEDN